VKHLALAVADQERSRRFYESYFGFDAQPSRWYDGGVLMLYNAEGFSLALGPTDEPDYVSVKCFDPDGYVVEAAWEPDRQ
jgi:Glyoxalase/Bleomycin resistance protein/Dioxygenase superfamily